MFAYYSNQERTGKDRSRRRSYSESKKNCYEEEDIESLLGTCAVKMDKFTQIGEKFGLEGEKPL